MTPDEVRARFERECTHDDVFFDVAENGRSVTADTALEFALDLAADLQSPPTGDDGKSAAVLARLEDALSAQLPSTRAFEIRPKRDGSWVVQAAPWLLDPVTGDTMIDAISAALDQLDGAEKDQP